MAKTTVFKSNQTQAVRLPKDVAFSEDVREVEVLVVGESRIITPAKTSWASWFNANSLKNRSATHYEPALYARYEYLHLYYEK